MSLSVSHLCKQVPAFYGTVKISDNEFIVLEDVSCGGHNVMDVKIGAVTWDKSADEQKVHSEKTKYRFGFEMGFRIQGYRVSCDINPNFRCLTSCFSGDGWSGRCAYFEKV